LMISGNVEFLPPIFYTVFWQPFSKFWKRIIAALMVTCRYVKLYVSIIIHLEVININVRNFNFPIGFYSNPHPVEPLNIWLWPPLPQSWKLKVQLETYIYNSTKFHKILSSSSWNLPSTSSWYTERKEKEENNNNNNKKRSKNNKSPKLCLGDLIILIAVSATHNLSY
jgi:hypothetical protein